jgi:sulfate adenylyltransferase subunit 1
MDLLRFITAGSVDDGKSTLIGRLLYDSKSILADQLDAIQRASRNSADALPDLALLTDGLRAEREQGITIDVAYKYFATPRRKFIIADTPGHVQYTRNMITGASNTDLIIILIDARQGVVEQTRRHSIIASILRIPHVVVAINKLDLLGYSQDAYNKIVADYQKVAQRLGLQEVTYIPVSALYGDNVVERSPAIGWYHGPSLLEHMETVELYNKTEHKRGRLYVQYVIRPQTEALHDYRGYAGKIISGRYTVGHEVTILPSGKKSRIRAIEQHGDRQITTAVAGQSVTIHLADNIDISRGDLIVSGDNQPEIAREHEALVCWMDERPLKTGRRYTLQIHSRTVTAIVTEIKHRVDVHTLEQITAVQARINEVVRVRLKTADPLAYDPYSSLRGNGSFILIDETSHTTAGGGLFQ